MVHGKSPQPSHPARDARQALHSQHRGRALVRARPYDRSAELVRVLPLWPHEANDATPEGRWAILSKLRRALRAERRRGVAGHWTYDLQRHIELLRVYRLELAAYAECGRHDPPARSVSDTSKKKQPGRE